MIEKIKALWKKIKAKTVTISEKIKVWFIKNWFIIVNYLVIFLAYSICYGKEGVVGAEALLGIWLFVSAAFGMYKIFKK